MTKELPKLLPVTILITSFNRLNLLKKTIDLINERTFYPFRIIVIDNASTDGSVGYLKTAKTYGKIFDHVFLEENIGQSKALNIGFAEIDKWEHGEDRPTRPSNDFFVTSNEDIYPPMLGQKNCWLTQMIDILKRHEPEYGGLCMRIQRLARTEIDENTEIIPCYKGFPSVFRLMRRDDVRQLGDKPFGFLRKWDSNSTADKYKLQIKKKFGFTTKIYADHAGFMLENKGFPDEVDTFTVAANKLNERNDKPYPDIDPETNVPIKINHGCDTKEQKLRDEYGKEEKPEATVIVLTCNRYDGLKRIVESTKEHTKIPYDLLVIIDLDDTDAYNYCLENNIKCLLSNHHRDFTAQANLGAYACETPYFVIFSDDLEVVDDNWLSESLRIFKEKFPNNIGLMSYNEEIQKGRIFTLGMSSKKFVHHINGNLYFPLYKHYKSDREVTELAKKLKCYHYAESIHIKHHHWQTDENVERDETYKLSKRKFLSYDQKLKNYRNENVDLVKEKNYCDYL